MFNITRHQPLVIFLIILCCACSACLEREEGCLDVLATNFQADADRACDNCCTYPTLTLNVTHNAGDTLLNYGDTLTANGQSFRIIETAFYAYRFELGNGSQTLGILDSIALLNRDSVTNTVTDDLQLITRNTTSFVYTLGNFAGAGSFIDFTFNMGLSDIMAQTNPYTVTDNYVLSDELGLFNTPDSAYVFTRIRLINTDNDDTLQYDLSSHINIALDYPVNVTRGENIAIPITVDYLKWIEGINFAGNQADNEAIIVQNLSNSVSVSN